MANSEDRKDRPEAGARGAGEQGAGGRERPEAERDGEPESALGGGSATRTVARPDD